MKLKYIMAIAVACLMTATNISAQNKPFTLDVLLWGGSDYWNYQPKHVFTAWWGDRLVKLDVEECTLLSSSNGKKAKPKTLFTLSEICECAGIDAKHKPRTLQNAKFPFADKTQVLLESSGKEYLIDWKARKVTGSRDIPEGAAARDVAKGSFCEAYVKNSNLYVMTPDGKEARLSSDGSRNIVYGQSVHRDEFGITKGTFWSPRGNKLAFYKMDQSMVTDYPLVDVTPLCADNSKDSAGVSRIAKLKPEKYPMAGETSHVVYVGVYDVNSGRTVYLQTADPVDRYFTNISWSPDEKTIYVFELNRDQNHEQLISYDAESGARKEILFEERNDKYVEPLHPLVFLPWDNGKFLFQSRRDGYNHLYLYDLKSRQTMQLTKGKFEVTQLLGFNPAAKSVIYISNEINPIQANIFAVSTTNMKSVLLDDGKGLHSAELSPSGKYLIDRASAPEYASKTVLRSTSSASAVTINQVEKHPWEEQFNMPEITSGTIKAADGVTDLYYRMIKPVGFNPAKKYPTVVYVYGGPHAHMIYGNHFYGVRGWEIYMAQKGYLIFVLDNRGSENRGFDFESVTFRHLGEEEMKDQMKGVEFLKSLPYVDADKIGVHGWSYGGFMTINLMCTYPDVFKVGVAGGPVIDWKYYEVMYGERYMDTPQQNPEGYKKCSLLGKASRLKGRLQIINGYNDPICVPQHTFSFLRACADAGTQPDYFTYPGAPHNMVGRDRIHLHERITRYFTDYLK